MWTTASSSSTTFSLISFKFNIISVTSSSTPGIVENSWSTPSNLTETIAAPCRDESRILLNALPIVIPNPLSRGSHVNFPYEFVELPRSISTRLGLINSRQFLLIKSTKKASPFDLLFSIGDWPLFISKCQESIVNNQLACHTLFRIQFYNKLFLNGHCNIFSIRQGF